MLIAAICFLFGVFALWKYSKLTKIENLLITISAAMLFFSIVPWAIDKYFAPAPKVENHGKFAVKEKPDSAKMTLPEFVKKFNDNSELMDRRKQNIRINERIKADKHGQFFINIKGSINFGGTVDAENKLEQITISYEDDRRTPVTNLFFALNVTMSVLNPDLDRNARLEFLFYDILNINDDKLTNLNDNIEYNGVEYEIRSTEKSLKLTAKL